MDKVEQLSVFYHGRQVGTLALCQNGLAAFSYTEQWLAEGFSISPFSLPLERKVYVPKPNPFDGLFGVFADSLPDGWGRLLTDRLMLKNQLNPLIPGNLDRLAMVGSTGRGALTYEPALPLKKQASRMSLDDAEAECRLLFAVQYTEKLDDLFAMGGSAGGVQPKILTRINGEDWLIKFPSPTDPPEIGRQEYDYALCAAECGIDMAPVRLFPSRNCEGYFGIRRFDMTNGKKGERRTHMISAPALLEIAYRMPTLDYDILMRLTLELTKDLSECEKLFRRMCFHVFARSRDDYPKNFSYLYLEKEARFVLSPAYNLTSSSSPGQSHAITVHGNGTDPAIPDLLAVAEGIGLDLEKAGRIARQIQECVMARLSRYLIR